MENPWAASPEIRSIDVRVSVEAKASTADILDLKLDGKTYQPGETVKGTLVIDPYRQSRQTKEVSLELPADLPEGSYQLMVCSAADCLREMQSEMPQRFDPHNLGDLMESLGQVTAQKTDRLYLHLQLPDGGIAIQHNELPQLPASKMQIILQGQKTDLQAFTQSLVRSVQGEYVYSGSASASFEVKRQVKGLSTREQRKPQ